MTARVQVVVEAKDEASGILRGISSQFGSFGKVIEDLTGSSINWGNVFTQATTMIVDGAKQSLEATQKYAKEVRDLSLASGQSAEESSRLIQVLDDYEISAQDVTAATRAMTKEGLAPTVETLATLSDQYLLLNTAQERNAFIMENLGRGGMQWANVLKEGGDAIRQMSNELDGSLILTEESIKQAEEYRLALDAWNDSVQALQISIGSKLMPVLTTFVNDLTGHNRVRQEANRLIEEGIARNREEALEMATNSIAAIDAYAARYEGLVTLYQDSIPVIEQVTMSNEDFLKGVANMQGVIESYEEKTNKLTEERMNLEAQKQDLLSKGYDSQSKEIIAINGKLEENKKKNSEVAAQFDLDNKKIMLGYLERRLTRDGTLDDKELQWLLEQGQAWGVYSEEAVTAMQTAMSEVDALILKYESIPDYISTTVNTNYTTTGSNTTGVIGGGQRYAAGGEVYAGKMVTVGENGQESFVPAQNGRILGHAESLHAAGMGGGANYFYGNVTLQIGSEDGSGLLEYR